MLTREQFDVLREKAQYAHKPISVLVREAVETVYLAEYAHQKRLEALAQLLTIDAEVAEWEQMEDEIERGALA
jgi:hypothetical protein